MSESAILWYNRAVKRQFTQPNPPAHNVSLADTLIAGFKVLRQRPWMLLLPLLLDVWLLFGLPITPQPLATNLTPSVERLQAVVGDDAATLTSVWSNVAGLDLRHVGVGTYMFASLSRAITVPSQSGAVWIPDSLPVLLGLWLGLNSVALGLSVLFLLPLGDVVAGQRRWQWGRLASTLWHLIKLLLLLLFIYALLLLPVLLSTVALLSVSPLAVQVALGLISIALLLVWLLCSFGIEAVIVGQVGPLTALYQSYNLVRHNWRATLIFVGATFVLSQGGALLLGPLLTTPTSMVAAAGIYAALSTTLAAARMVFYRDHVAHLEHTVPIIFASEG